MSCEVSHQEHSRSEQEAACIPNTLPAGRPQTRSRQEAAGQARVRASGRTKSPSHRRDNWLRGGNLTQQLSGHLGHPHPTPAWGRTSAPCAGTWEAAGEGSSAWAPATLSETWTEFRLPTAPAVAVAAICGVNHQLQGLSLPHSLSPAPTLLPVCAHTCKHLP